MSDVLGTIASGGSRIGRYFSVVSALPSTIFAGYVFLLARTGAFTGPVRWSRVTELGAVDLLVLGLVSFVLALALHPLQFTIVQLYEGYWGTSRLGLGLALVRTLHHRRRRLLLAGRRWRSSAAASTAMTAFARPRQVAARIENAESARLLGSYPDRLELTLPTRLGNVLRRYESTVGAPYGMEAMQAIPRLAMVAGERELDYLQNQRFQLDLAVRTSFLGFAATLVTAAAMWRHGWWMLLALIPYAVGYLAYRGAIVLAHEYGTSAAVMMDLSRFALYDKMRLPPPDDNEDELRANPHLMRAFRSERPPPLPGEAGALGARRVPGPVLDYQQPPPATPPGEESPPGAADTD